MNKTTYYIFLALMVLGLGVSSVFVKDTTLKLILSSLFVVAVIVLYFMRNKLIGVKNE